MDSSCGGGKQEGDPIASEDLECLIKNDWKEVSRTPYATQDTLGDRVRQQHALGSDSSEVHCASAVL